MPWTPKQKRYLLSSSSPLTPKQKGSMVSELHASPSLGHATKGSSRKTKGMSASRPLK